jgi:hypothetical protein
VGKCGDQTENNHGQEMDGEKSGCNHVALGVVTMVAHSLDGFSYGFNCRMSPFNGMVRLWIKE